MRRREFLKALSSVPILGLIGKQIPIEGVPPTGEVTHPAPNEVKIARYEFSGIKNDDTWLVPETYGNVSRVEFFPFVGEPDAFVDYDGKHVTFKTTGTASGQLLLLSRRIRT